MMLYESAARADEVLCLNVEDLYPQDKRGRITAKGGATEWIPAGRSRSHASAPCAPGRCFWASTTARSSTAVDSVTVPGLTS